MLKLDSAHSVPSLGLMVVQSAVEIGLVIGCIYRDLGRLVSFPKALGSLVLLCARLR